MGIIRMAAATVVAGTLVVGCAAEGGPPTDPVSPPAFSAGNSGPSANGQATLPMELLGGRQTVAFHVREFADGSVRGSFESKSRGQDLEVHANLDCLAITGNEAIAGGVVTQSRVDPSFPFPIPVGTRIWFRVRDNGEGANAPPDEFTDWFFGAPELGFTLTVCAPNVFEEFPEFIPGYAPLANGNVQVKP